MVGEHNLLFVYIWKYFGETCIIKENEYGCEHDILRYKGGRIYFDESWSGSVIFDKQKRIMLSEY